MSEELFISIDSIIEGDFIVRVDHNYRPSIMYQDRYNQHWEAGNEPTIGIPEKVISVSKPIILTRPVIFPNNYKDYEGQQLKILDSRYENFITVSRKYAQEFAKNKLGEIPSEFKTEEEIKEDGKKCCPYCKQTLAQRMNLAKEWFHVCKDCKIKVVKL